MIENAREIVVVPLAEDMADMLEKNDLYEQHNFIHSVSETKGNVWQTEGRKTKPKTIPGKPQQFA